MKKIVKNNTKSARIYVNILGINVLVTRTTEVLTGVEAKIADNVKFSILTPNPELVLSSTQDPRLKDALNSADFSIPDGTGLAYASKFLYGRDLNIIHGRILFMELINLAAKKGWKVFLLGGFDNEAELTASKLKNENFKLKIETLGGKEVRPELTKAQIDKINSFKPDLLFVAFGNPKQEIWIHKNLSKLNVGGAMAVGGTFRYVAGLAKLPPKWMENLGLEWLWRVFAEPARLGRIFNAVIVFPWKVLIYKISGNN